MLFGSLGSWILPFRLAFSIDKRLTSRQVPARAGGRYRFNFFPFFLLDKDNNSLYSMYGNHRGAGRVSSNSVNSLGVARWLCCAWQSPPSPPASASSARAGTPPSLLKSHPAAA